MRIAKTLSLALVTALVGCTTARHSDECTESCLSAGKDRAIAHLKARLEENRAELERIEDPARRYVVLEIIAGLEAHIDYIRSKASQDK